MKVGNDKGGSQRRTTLPRAPEVRQRESARRANSPSAGVQAVRQRTRKASNPPSIRHPDAYENRDTETAPVPQIPASIIESDGRNDKVRIVCDLATVTFQTEDDLNSFVFHCGGAPKDQRGEHELFSKLFNIARNNGFTNTVKIRESTLRYDGQIFRAPLFTGKLTLRKMQNPRMGVESQIVASIRADLCLNMNRALNHRRTELHDLSPSAIFKSADSTALGLCGNDNVAPLQLFNGEHDNARRHLFNTVINALFEDIQRAASASEASGSEMVNVALNLGNFSLQDVETCWDIGSLNFDAVKTLADIKPKIQECGGKRGWEGNAGTLTVEFSQSERLVVYAKSTNRIRFEIKQYPTKGKTRYSAPTINGLIGILDTMRKSAAKRINKILSFIADHSNTSVAASDWESYAIRWGHRMGISQPSLELYRLLRRHERVIGGRFVQCIQGAAALLRKARDAGLLRHQNNAYRPIF